MLKRFLLLAVASGAALALLTTHENRSAFALPVLSGAPAQGGVTLRDWVNVRTDFGAVGNGVANDTAAFANAIAAFELSRDAAYILVPPGTYLVDDIKVVHNLHLKGSGKGRTIIKARNAGVGAGIVRRDANSGAIQQVTVENLLLQDFLYGIDARSIYYSEFRNLYVIGCGTGIYLGRRNAMEGLSLADVFIDVRVVDSTTLTMDVDGSVPGDLVNACQFHSCLFESKTAKPILFHGNGGNGLAGNSFHGSSLCGAPMHLVQCSGLGWYGGYVEGASIDADNGVSGLIVTGTYFQVASGFGIRIGTGSGQPVFGVTIGACTFTSTGGGTGIEIRADIGAAANGIVILPNHFFGPITPIVDTGRHAELKVTPGVIAASGYLTVSNTDARVMSGDQLPEGRVSAPVGSLYLHTNGTQNTTLWVKEQSGAGNTGWRAK